jgi:FAD/FMN-containing dehydrogenase
MSASASTDWHALRRAIAGEVVLPDSPGYDAVRKPAIARFDDVRPQAVVRCRTAADVAATIAAVRGLALPIAVRSGGHCFAGRSSTDGVVVDVSPMGSVSVADGVATIGAGARLGAVYDALDEHGVTIPAGCGPTVGIAGLTLGGGLGILGRRDGLTSDHLLAAEVVLADGRVVASDAGREEDLLWALRGAGAAGFGVVTSLRFATLPAPPVATRMHAVWPHTAAAALVDAWQRWGPDAPDELAASLLISAPADVRQAPVVTLTGAMAGDLSEAAPLLDELCATAGVDRAAVVVREASYRETKQALAQLGDPSEEGHPYSKSEFFAGLLPTDAIAALVEHFGAGRVAGQARELDLTPWGGAYNRVPAEATAFAHRDARFLLKHGVMVAPDASGDARDAARRWLERSWELVHPFGTGRVYPNFPDPELGDEAGAYYAGNRARVMTVKARHDPDDAFGAVPPLPERSIG